MPKSTTRSKSRRSDPASKKPYVGFPLTAHPTGRWCKKHKGSTYYFGPLADWQAAKAEYERQWPYIIDGRTPPPVNDDACTVADLVNAFLDSKEAKLNSDELSRQTFADYHLTCKRLVEHFGRHRRVDDLRPDDFEALRSKLAAKFSVVTLKNEINRARVVFSYAHKQGFIDAPVRYGESFDRPSAMMLRKARHDAGPRLFTADELQRILGACDPVFRAIVLLGINAGFGNTDVASLPQSALDLRGGWCTFPRPKTQIQRRVPLWPDTVAALRTAIDLRPAPKHRDDADLCFITVQGNRWVRTSPSRKTEGKFVTVNTVAGRFGAILRDLKINGRTGLGFYSLRHTFETVAGESKDQVAVNSIMGHVDPSMAAVYREGISDERLRAVVGVVRAWLWAGKKRRKK